MKEDQQSDNKSHHPGDCNFITLNKLLEASQRVVQAQTSQQAVRATATRLIQSSDWRVFTSILTNLNKRMTKTKSKHAEYGQFLVEADRFIRELLNFSIDLFKADHFDSAKMLLFSLKDINKSYKESSANLMYHLNYALIILGHIHIKQGNFSAAYARFLQAIERIQKLPDNQNNKVHIIFAKLTLHIGFSYLYLARGELTHVESYTNKAIKFKRNLMEISTKISQNHHSAHQIPKYIFNGSLIDDLITLTANLASAFESKTLYSKAGYYHDLHAVLLEELIQDKQNILPKKLQKLPKHLNTLLCMMTQQALELHKQQASDSKEKAKVCREKHFSALKNIIAKYSSINLTINDEKKSISIGFEHRKLFQKAKKLLNKKRLCFQSNHKSNQVVIAYIDITQKQFVDFLEWVTRSKKQMKESYERGQIAKERIQASPPIRSNEQKTASQEPSSLEGHDTVKSISHTPAKPQNNRRRTHRKGRGTPRRKGRDTTRSRKRQPQQQARHNKIPLLKIQFGALYEHYDLYPVNANGLPRNSFFAMINTKIVQAKLGETELSRCVQVLGNGRFIGKYGNGVKFIKRESQQKKAIPAGYNYKIKTQSDARVYGKEVASIFDPNDDNKKCHAILFDFVLPKTH